MGNQKKKSNKGRPYCSHCKTGQAHKGESLEAARETSNHKRKIGVEGALVSFHDSYEDYSKHMLFSAFNKAHTGKKNIEILERTRINIPFDDKDFSID